MSDVLKHTPKPLIEEHYHINALINAQEKRTADRVFHQNKLKELNDREDYITDSKPVIQTDFWCNKCKKDFKGQAVRQIEVDWSNTSQRIAYYKTKCFKGHWCMRLVTDRHKDGFFIQSKLMALDRGNHYADTVQPNETNFNLLYGKK